MEVLVARLDRLDHREAEIRRLNVVNDGLLRRVTALERLVPESHNPENQGEVIMKGSAVDEPVNFKQTWAWIPHDAASIGSGAFAGHKSLVDVVFQQQDRLLRIDYQAFCGCTALQAVAIPASVEVLGAEAFFYCDALVRVEFMSVSKLHDLGTQAFAYCRSLESVEIPPLVRRIPPFCFFDCSSLESVRLTGPNLSTICDGAFGRCCRLKIITLPASIVQIGDDGAFGECLALEQVKFGGRSSLESLGSKCFLNCRKLRLVEFEKCPKLKSIGDLAFVGSKLTALRLAATSLVELGASSFRDCVSLVKVAFPPTLTKIGSKAFAGCVEISTLTFTGASLADVGDGAFGDCVKLKEKAPLIVPPSLKTVGEKAFPCAWKSA